VRRRRRYLLDGIGLSIYERIDGKKTFEQLVDEFGAEHKLTFFESRALLTTYLQLLTRRGLIAVGVKRRGNEA